MKLKDKRSIKLFGVVEMFCGIIVTIFGFFSFIRKASDLSNLLMLFMGLLLIGSGIYYYFVSKKY